MYRATQWALGRVGGYANRTYQICDYLKYRSFLHFRFKPRDDDIFVTTYPKAGTSLMQMMVYQLTTDGDLSFSHIDAVAPFFMPAAVYHPHRIEALAPPRIFKTHLRWRDLPRRGRFIYVVRNAFDTCLSYYHHLTPYPCSASLDRFVNRFVAGELPYGSWFGHLTAWRPYRNHPHVLTLRYEALREDLTATILQVAQFLGVACPPRVLRRVQERCSFAFMKRHTLKFDPRFAASTTLVDFVRRGAVGEGMQVLSPHHRQQLMRALKKLQVRGESPAWLGLTPMTADGVRHTMECDWPTVVAEQ